MERENYIHSRQNEAYVKYRDGVSFQEDIESVYEDIDYKIRRPDLLGKTVKVTDKQFSDVYLILKEIAESDRVQIPEVCVYEDYYYGAESYGISKPWIELSAKTIQDFTKEELKFVLAREIYKISDGVTKQKTMMEERFKAIRMVAPDDMEKISKLSFYHWYRLANYSADNYGYLMCGSVKSSVDAILKMVLNSIPLAEQVDVKEFIGQASEINSLDDMTYNYTKADESIPYAPHRLQNLLAYAVSERGMKAIETKRKGGI
jgi:hypothetical protein